MSLDSKLIQRIFIPLSLCDKRFRDFFIKCSIGKKRVWEASIMKKIQKVFKPGSKNCAPRLAGVNRAWPVVRCVLCAAASGVRFPNHFVPVKQFDALNKCVKIISGIHWGGVAVGSWSFHVGN